MDLGTFKIEILDTPDSERVLAFYEAASRPYVGHDRLTLIEGIESGAWTALMAVAGGRDIGGGYINWRPKYRLYERLGLPEVQDLRVLEAYRRHGAGEALVTAAEDRARKRGCTGLGISVGLHAGFGAAQRLYTRLGFMPDGLGVTYDREPVPEGEKRPIDDDLALMLLKHF